MRILIFLSLTTLLSVPALAAKSKGGSVSILGYHRAFSGGGSVLNSDVSSIEHNTSMLARTKKYSIEGTYTDSEPRSPYRIGLFDSATSPIAAALSFESTFDDDLTSDTSENESTSDAGDYLYASSVIRGGVAFGTDLVKLGLGANYYTFRHYDSSFEETKSDSELTFNAGSSLAVSDAFIFGFSVRNLGKDGGGAGTGKVYQLGLGYSPSKNDGFSFGLDLVAAEAENLFEQDVIFALSVPTLDLLRILVSARYNQPSENWRFSGGIALENRPVQLVYAYEDFESSGRHTLGLAFYVGA